MVQSILQGSCTYDLLQKFVIYKKTHPTIPKNGRALYIEMTNYPNKNTYFEVARKNPKTTNKIDTLVELYRGQTFDIVCITEKDIVLQHFIVRSR